MPIITACTCGKKLRTRDDLAGKRIQCPACGMILTVAVPVDEQTLVDAPDDVEDTVELSVELTRQLPAVKDQFWFNPAGEDNAIAVTDASIYVARCDRKLLEAVRSSLEVGEPAWKVLKTAETVIALDDVEKVESDLHGERIAVFRRSGKGPRQSPTSISCPDRNARDEIMEALHERLGKGWRMEEVEAPWLRLVALPLGVAGVLLVLCLGLFLANVGLGPVAVVVAGLVVLAGGVAWSVARVRTAPVVLTIRKVP